MKHIIKSIFLLFLFVHISEAQDCNPTYNCNVIISTITNNPTGALYILLYPLTSFATIDEYKTDVYFANGIFSSFQSVLGWNAYTKLKSL